MELKQPAKRQHIETKWAAHSRASHHKTNTVTCCQLIGLLAREFCIQKKGKGEGTHILYIYFFFLSSGTLKAILVYFWY